ncbi:hypothetical protein DDR33_24795 [Pararcticibacter amylolyticus]|uniref:Uncharacterized protein n=1 Tax=Pararcticibacter amylolyticus TaxID=2173175 RepID=A0A2U2P9A0_9SPHI|nr:hypothetical protein DDR33_24795 [Pararcticibacter amylolyticus]
MYKAYDNKNDSPIRRTFMYMSLLIFYLVAVLLLFVKKILEKINFSINNKIDNSPFFWIAIAISVCLLTYLTYTRKDFSYFENKFSNCVELNKRIRLWMLIAFPFVLLFFSFFIYVLLFGGQILNKEIAGIWR